MAEAPRAFCASPFIPPEFVAAHGFRPWRIAVADPVGCHEGRCAIAAGWEGALAGGDQRPATGDVAITVNSCDQMRRSAEDASLPVFAFAMPATWQTANARRTWAEELERLSAFLVRHGGTRPDRPTLVRHLLDHDARRARLRAACAALPARAAAELLAAYAAGGTAPALAPAVAAADGRAPVALLGGPVAPADFAFYDLVEAAGLRIALDGSETGERGLAAPLDRRLAAADPDAALVEAYLLGIPDAFRRPDSLLFAWLERRLAGRGLRAIVVRLDPWCDLWRGALARLREWGRLPVVAVEAGEPAARTATRLTALAEML